jgi:6-phosphogluconolactonase/glucosamine-6-phosphate isomerase/deaminase
MHEAILKLVQVAYEMIISIYKQSWKEGMPVPKDEWIQNEERMQSIYDEIREQFLDEMFMNASRLSRDDFIRKMREGLSKYLKAHELR